MSSIATHSPPAARYSTANVPLTWASHSQVKRADEAESFVSSIDGFAGGTTSRRTHSLATLLTARPAVPFLSDSTMQRTWVPRSSSPTVSDSCELDTRSTSVHASVPRGAVCHVYVSFSAASPSTFVATPNTAFCPLSTTATGGATVASYNALPSGVAKPGPSTATDCSLSASTWVTRHS